MSSRVQSTRTISSISEYISALVTRGKYKFLSFLLESSQKCLTFNFWKSDLCFSGRFSLPLQSCVTTLMGRRTAPSHRNWRLPRRRTTTCVPATHLPSAAVASAKTTVNQDRISSDTESELGRQLSLESSVLAKISSLVPFL